MMSHDTRSERRESRADDITPWRHIKPLWKLVFVNTCNDLKIQAFD